MLTVEAAILQALLAEGRTPDVAAGLSPPESTGQFAGKRRDGAEGCVCACEKARHLHAGGGAGRRRDGYGGVGTGCGKNREDLVDRLVGTVSITNYNCPGQIVITRRKRAAAAAGEQCKGAARSVWCQL